LVKSSIGKKYAGQAGEAGEAGAKESRSLGIRKKVEVRRATSNAAFSSLVENPPFQHHLHHLPLYSACFRQQGRNERLPALPTAHTAEFVFNTPFHAA
jgi:hypothetical protein